MEEYNNLLQEQEKQDWFFSFHFVWRCLEEEKNLLINPKKNTMK